MPVGFCVEDVQLNVELDVQLQLGLNKELFFIRDFYSKDGIKTFIIYIIEQGSDCIETIYVSQDSELYDALKQTNLYKKDQKLARSKED